MRLRENTFNLPQKLRISIRPEQDSLLAESHLVGSHPVGNLLAHSLLARSLCISLKRDH